VIKEAGWEETRNGKECKRRRRKKERKKIFCNGRFLHPSFLPSFFAMADPVADPVEAWYLAVFEGHVEVAISLLRDHPGINVNWVDETQYTALHRASIGGSVEIVKVLLAHPDISVNLKTSFGQTSLFKVCEYGHESVIQVMLKDPRIDVTLSDDHGCTPHCGKHRMWAIMQLSSGSLPVAEISQTSRKGMMAASTPTTTPPLKLPERSTDLKWCLCWNDSWPTLCKPVIRSVWSLDCWMRWQLRCLP